MSNAILLRSQYSRRLLLAAMLAGLWRSVGAQACGDACDQAELRYVLASGRECNGLAVAKLYLFNKHASRQIDIYLNRNKYLLPQRILVDSGRMNQHWVLSPGQQSDLVGCTGEIDLSDINNPRTYELEYAKAEVNFVGGTTESCPQLRPVLQQCAVPSDPDFVPGVYEIRAANHTYAVTEIVSQEGNTTRTRIVNAPICMDVSTDNGTIQQIRCSGSAAQRFYIGQSLSGCFELRQVNSTGRVMLPEADAVTGRSALLGWGESQVGACPFRRTKFHWQLKRAIGDVFEIKNQGTGACIQIDGSNVTPGGAIDVIPCRGVGVEQWRLRRLDP